MSEKLKQKTVFVTQSISVDNPEQIIKIDYKFGSHIQSIHAVSFHILTGNTIAMEKPQCGELSLSVNNGKDLMIHTTPTACFNFSENINQELPVDVILEKNSRLSGYYRDYGTLKDENDDFVSYHLKIIYECVANQ